MRTTITLDADVEALVRKSMRERKVSFKRAVNDALRQTLSTRNRSERFRTATFDTGPAYVDLVRATQLAGELEDAELLHKARLSK